MLHNYREIVAYNNIENKITNMITLPEDALFDEKAYKKAFYCIYKQLDPAYEQELGVSITGNFYQLSLTEYGYIKEDASSVEKFLSRNKILCAIAKFKEANHIKFRN